MSISTAGAIFLGWFLGLLSPVIVDAIRKRYRQKEIREGIFTELRDLRLRMVFAAYKFENRFGTYDRALLNWVISILENYNGPTDMDQSLEALKKLAALDDQKLQALASHSKKPGGGLNVKKYRIPYLDSNIGELGIFDERTRAAILDIRAHLDLFNEEIDEARLYHKMTFELSDPGNHEIACQNVESCYRNLAQKARHIVDRIGPILPR